MRKRWKRGTAPAHVFVLIFLLVLLASLLTWLIPAGSFERVKDVASGQTLVIPGSYVRTDAVPVAPWKVPALFFEAVSAEGTARLAFFILFIGGAFEIVMQTGCLNVLCERTLIRFRRHPDWIIPVFVSLFSIFGFTMGLSTASVIFVPIGIAAAAVLGFDRMTGVAMVALGTNAGFAAGIFNPFSVGIAQTIAEVPMYSGAWMRVLLLIALVSATSLYVMRRSERLKPEDGQAGVMSDARFPISEVGMKESRPDGSKRSEAQPAARLTIRQKIVLLAFLGFFLLLTTGVACLDFSTADMAVAFLIMGFAIGLLAGFGINQTCELFVKGCQRMMTGVIVIGLAAAMRQVLTEGRILDTVTLALTGLSVNLPGWAQLTGMYLGNAALDLAITSGTAHAAVAMPIMTPMADLMGLTRQSAVFAFQLGDGLVNLTSPISTTLTGVLAVSNLPYGRWMRFFLPLVGIYLLIGEAFLVIAGLTGY